MSQPKTTRLQFDFVPRTALEQSAEDSNYIGADEPEIDDTVHACPDCETPNQFGELCGRCIIDRELTREL